MATYSFPTAPESADNSLNSIKDLVRIINNLMQGKSNNTVNISLNTAGTTTVFTDPRLAGESFIDLMPLTSLAAVDKGRIYYTAQDKGTVTINHPVNAGARDYRLVIIA